MLKTIRIYSFRISMILLLLVSSSQAEETFVGDWTLIRERSSEIDLYETVSLNIQLTGANLTLIQKWGTGRSYADTLKIKVDGSALTVPIKSRIFPTNVFMGLSMPVGKVKKVSARWEIPEKKLIVNETYDILGSQGANALSLVHTYQFTPNQEALVYQIDRSSRQTGPETKYLFKRTGTRNACYMELEDDWKIDSKLSTNALLISLQGLANQNGPQLYFIYPKTWDYRFTPAVFDFLKNDRFFSFTQLSTAEQALNKFKDQIKGYVVWDKSVRTSLIVAYTVAGLEKAVVVSEEQLPLMEKLGIKAVEDFRGKFTGQTDVQIYTRAYEKYWPRCSKEYIVWLGGEHGNIMKPGVADWGIMKHAFFNDLSTRETDIEEYTLAKKILSEMKPLSFVFGWHSYKKDKEREHVKLTSSFALRVEGLHTLPNMSFSSQVPVSPGFKFKNKHNLVPGKQYMPEKKVYVACIQTDCLGLGAWTQPGRGEIPYAWEVTMNWVWLAPAMMEYFYSQATPNDYFIGSLSGPGYMYPKAIPKKYLPEVIKIARDLMQQLDLNVFEIMDYSEGATVEGNSDLPREIVDAYYKGMPDAIGFANGYAPSYTFTSKDGRPFISYDYYLSPSRPEADAVADLQELASINAKRPYFLLLHVRQWSDITRVKGILDKLGPEFEVVPLDIFLKMAGNQPTFKERFKE
ncbi:hypothetical protein JW964_22070 [candidate division KSB1 bacterium]|nr:hypothetical protein [candidate division KSB1 bacterium]